MHNTQQCNTQEWLICPPSFLCWGWSPYDMNDTFFSVEWWKRVNNEGRPLLFTLFLLILMSCPLSAPVGQLLDPPESTRQIPYPLDWLVRWLQSTNNSCQPSFHNDHIIAPEYCWFPSPGQLFRITGIQAIHRQRQRWICLDAHLRSRDFVWPQTRVQNRSQLYRSGWLLFCTYSE